MSWLRDLNTWWHMRVLKQGSHILGGYTDWHWTNKCDLDYCGVPNRRGYARELKAYRKAQR